MNPDKITWQVPNKDSGPRSGDWFWAVAILMITVAGLALYFGNILLAIVIVLGGITVMMAGRSEPMIVQYEINRKGIEVGEILYGYASLGSFWVIDELVDRRDRVIIKSKKIFMSNMILPLSGEVNPNDIREYLLDYLNEEELEESLSHIIAERIGL